MGRRLLNMASKQRTELGQNDGVRLRQVSPVIAKEYTGDRVLAEIYSVRNE